MIYFPIKLFYVTDKDKVLNFANNKWKFALPKDDDTYYRCNIKNAQYARDEQVCTRQDMS